MFRSSLSADAGLLDRGQRRCGRLGRVGDHLGRYPGLHVDHRDIVGHRVVQFACDPQPLGSRPDGGRRRPCCARPARRGPGSAATAERWLRTATARPPTAMPVQAKIPRFSCGVPGGPLESIAEPVSTAMVSSPTRQVVGRSVREATV